MTDINVQFDSLDDKSLDVRHAAVEKIVTAGKKNTNQVVPAVIAKLRISTLDTRWYLGRSLVKMGPGIIPIIIEYAELEEDTNVQKYFGAVLASFGEIAILPLISLFSSTNPATRGMAAAALERLGTKAIPTLIEASLGDDPQVKLCAELTLMKLNTFNYK
jgi:HEAT repeat protein